MVSFCPKNLVLVPPWEHLVVNIVSKFQLIWMNRFRVLMSQLLKNAISRKTRLKFLFYMLFIWRRLALEAHISKTKRDIEKSFGTVIPDKYSYKKMQKKKIDFLKILDWSAPLTLSSP